MQLANVLSTEALFYTCIFPFIAFFGSFAFVLYPLRDVLHPTGVFSLPALQQCTCSGLCRWCMHVHDAVLRPVSGSHATRAI